MQRKNIGIMFLISILMTLYVFKNIEMLIVPQPVIPIITIFKSTSAFVKKLPIRKK